ncbi:hypothetical protein [Candidatus Parabeggiatoa sp. HSG14]|uniref:hypothetical protein n=1 Tax=Candidatus Parabeggiatoa sp. HSG14 TaxID=3055593 RepID=UPI0025A87D69|nr:hypothetical protein [Thiotrichales bacterium HSG14]
MKIVIKTIVLVWLIAIVLSSCANPPIQPTPENPENSVKKVMKVLKLPAIQMTERDVAIIGHKIWMNEGDSKVKNLTVWDKGNAFASLGIGHFIWYPMGKKMRYHEQFPELLVFLQQQRIALPEWLQNNPDCPWNTHQEFYDNLYTVKMTKLRKLLKNTIPQQVKFMIKRLEKTLPKMTAILGTKAKQDHLRRQFYRVTKTPSGVYALLDYLNFKGEGISLKERYKGNGWGLLQVLENMPGNTNDVMMEFAKSADFVLMRRVQNGQREDSLWLSTWKNRVKTYTQEL